MSDKVEIDLEDLDDLKDLIGDERKGASFSFQKVFAHLVLNWQWYLLSLIICMCGAYLYLRYAQPIYQVSARMLVKDEDKKAGTPIKQMLPNMEDFGIMNNSSGFDNEIEILQSPVTVHDAVKRLKLYTDYQLDGRIRKQLLYANQPVSVDLDPMSLDSLDYYMLEGIRSIQIAIMKKEEGYHADIGLVYNGKVMKEYSEDIDSLGTLLKTDYGTISFMSNPKYRTNEEDRFKKGFALLVTIRPPMVVALDYMQRLNVKPTSKKTTIASITLNDENVIRGVDFIRQERDSDEDGTIHQRALREDRQRTGNDGEFFRELQTAQLGHPTGCRRGTVTTTLGPICSTSGRNQHATAAARVFATIFGQPR